MSEARKSGQLFNELTALVFILMIIFSQCTKPSNPSPTPPPPPATSSFDVLSQTINSLSFNSTQTLYGINNSPSIKISFSDKMDRNSVSSALSYTNKTQNSANVPFTVSYQNNDSTLVISANNLNYLNEHIFSVST